MGFEKTGGFDVQFLTYSGMPIPLGNDLSKDEAADIIRRRISRAKRDGQPYSKVGRGEWEFETPEDAYGISDNDGFLTLRPHRRYFRRVLGRRIYL